MCGLLKTGVSKTTARWRTAGTVFTQSSTNRQEIHSNLDHPFLADSLISCSDSCRKALQSWCQTSRGFLGVCRCLSLKRPPKARCCRLVVFRMLSARNCSTNSEVAEGGVEEVEGALVGTHEVYHKSSLLPWKLVAIFRRWGKWGCFECCQPEFLAGEMAVSSVQFSGSFSLSGPVAQVW